MSPRFLEGQLHRLGRRCRCLRNPKDIHHGDTEGTEEDKGLGG